MGLSLCLTLFLIISTFLLALVPLAVTDTHVHVSGPAGVERAQRRGAGVWQPAGGAAHIRPQAVSAPAHSPLPRAGH